MVLGPPCPSCLTPIESSYRGESKMVAPHPPSVGLEHACVMHGENVCPGQDIYEPQAQAQVQSHYPREVIQQRSSR
jgi:hypothetical protein